jgi:hypothetical protein
VISEAAVRVRSSEPEVDEERSFEPEGREGEGGRSGHEIALPKEKRRSADP